MAGETELYILSQTSNRQSLAITIFLIIIFLLFGLFLYYNDMIEVFHVIIIIIIEIALIISFIYLVLKLKKNVKGKND